MRGTPPTGFSSSDFSLSRRQFLKAGGALVISFSLGHVLSAFAKGAPRPVSQFDVVEQLKRAPDVDSWLRIDSDGGVTFFTGKIEMGNGAITTLTQIVAEELDVPVQRVGVVSGDTDRVPEQGPTSASTSTSLAGSVLRSAAAEARQALLEMASERFKVPADRLQVRDGVVFLQGNPSRQVTYGELIGGQRFQRRITGEAPVKDPRSYRVVGRSVPRIDLPVKLTAGQGDYVENVRIPGALHARIVRVPSYGGRFRDVPEREILSLPGVVAVLPFRFPGDPRLDRVKDLAFPPGDWVAVVAEREDQAVRAAQRLEELMAWEEGPGFPTDSEGLYDWMQREPAETAVLRTDPQNVFSARLSAADHVLEAVYQGPYQSHAPMSPCCALAEVQGDRVTLWSASQAPFFSRWIVSQALGIDPENVRIRAMDSSGLYGRRDDFDHEVDVEAAVIAQAVGKPVRLVWTRRDEFQWGPYRPPQVIRLRGALEMGSISSVEADIWYASRHDHPRGDIAGMGLAHFNGYGFGHGVVRAHRVEGPIRTAFMRNVYHSHNVFALESFMDEMAVAAGQDPLAFRLRHLTDRRARAVLGAAARRVGWEPHAGASGRGVGIALNVYDSGAAGVYVAHAAEVEVNRETGQMRVKRMVAAVDPGLVVNPDGLKNQIEGGTIQATSWALKEELPFTRKGITATHWRSYPILRFSEVPHVEPVLIHRPDKPPLGIGEPVTVPVAPAIANAVYDAVGVRIRRLPFTPERVQQALAHPVA